MGNNASQPTAVVPHSDDGQLNPADYKGVNPFEVDPGQDDSYYLIEEDIEDGEEGTPNGKDYEILSPRGESSDESTSTTSTTTPDFYSNNKKGTFKFDDAAFPPLGGATHTNGGWLGGAGPKKRIVKVDKSSLLGTSVGKAQPILREKTEEEKKLEQLFVMRRENLNEILETERRYVDTLRICVKVKYYNLLAIFLIIKTGLFRAYEK
jgi:hypothetical protein